MKVRRSVAILAALVVALVAVFAVSAGTGGAQGSFQAAFNDVATFGGGFDIRAGATARASIPNMRRELDYRLGTHAADARTALSTLPP